MARRTRTITIEEEGRDKGKVFILTEMPAVAAERWATQALYLLAAAGVPAAEEAEGMAGLAQIPWGSFAQVRALQDPSLDAWWECVRYQHRPSHPPQPIAQGENCQIEELRTIGHLRLEVLRLHMDFFSAENPSTSGPLSSPAPRAVSATRTSRPS